MRKESLRVKCGTFWTHIQSEYIYYLMAVHGKVQIRVNKHLYTIPGTLEEVLKRLPKDRFAQIHQRYAVSLEYIDTVSTVGVTITQARNVYLPITKKYYTELMKRVKIVGVVVRKAPTTG